MEKNAEYYHKLTDGLTKSEAMNYFAYELLMAGFEIIAYEKTETWFLFAKDNKIGYVQDNRFDGFSMSTVHKPNRECGTGFRFTEGWGILTVENALNCANCFAAHWASKKDREAIVKYSNAQDYINNAIVLKYRLITA